MLPSPFREAVAAIDAGDAATLASLLAAAPRLVRDRIAGYGEGYFREPYLLWFVAENPVRRGRLPANIADVARLIADEAKRTEVDALQPQLDYALGLVCSGRIPRECGVQGALIDVLMDAGARPEGPLVAALAHRAMDAAEHLLRRGAPLTLLAAACTGRADDVARLLPHADARDRQMALTGAALHGRAEILPAILASGVDLNAYSSAELHPHATALHHAVDSASLDAVKALVDAGASLTPKDRVYGATPLDWAEYLGREEIAAYLLSIGAARG